MTLIEQSKLTGISFSNLELSSEIDGSKDEGKMLDEMKKKEINGKKKEEKCLSQKDLD